MTLKKEIKDAGLMLSFVAALAWPHLKKQSQKNRICEINKGRLPVDAKLKQTLKNLKVW